MPAIPIKFLETSNLKLTFTNKIMTSYGGFCLLAKLFEKLDLAQNVEQMIPVIETSPNSTGIYSKVLKFGLTVLAGGSKFTHSLFLGDSLEVYQTLFGVDKMVKSATALTRLFTKINTFKESILLSENLWNYTFSRVIPLIKIQEDYLNFDSTVITRYGKQEGATKGYNPKKKGRPSNNPLMAFLNRSRYVVNFWNRQGKAASGNGIVDFTKETIARLDGKVKITGCVADTGFYGINFIQYLEKIKLKYIIGVPLLYPVQRQIVAISEWEELEEGIAVSEMSFCHEDEKWDKKRRYIVIRQEINKLEEPKGKQLSLFEEDNVQIRFRYGCYITTFNNDAASIWRKYRLRADDENRIKENKMDFALEGFSLDSFYATEAAMLIRILFYNIINFFRTEILPNDEHNKTLQTLRQKYFVIPALLGADGKTPILRLGARNPSTKEKYKWILRRIDNVFQDPLINAVHLQVSKNRVRRFFDKMIDKIFK